MKYVANVLLPNTTEYERYEVPVEQTGFFPQTRAHLRACRIAKTGAKRNHCHASVSYEEAGCPTKIVKEYDFTEKYDD